MKTIVYFLLSAFAIYFVATHLGSDFGILLSGEKPYISALIFAFILAVTNTILWTILRIITFPINFLTFWLFSLLITCLMIFLTDSFYENITVTNIFGYIIIALVPSIIGVILWKK